MASSLSKMKVIFKVMECSSLLGCQDRRPLPTSPLTLPAGNLRRNSGVRLVWPKWKWGGADSTRT